MQKKTYWLETYGCQMNKAESGTLELMLRQRGWMVAPVQEKAELVILNTCSVRATAEKRIWGRLGFFRHLKQQHDFILAVMGCMSQRLKHDLIKKAPEIDIVAGNFQKHKLVTIIEKTRSIKRKNVLTREGDYRFAPRHFVQGFKAFVPIMHGCNNFCSYCIVPYVRGREISRNPGDIVREIKRLDASGTCEVTLLGQNVNSYYFTPNGRGINFPRLLEKILSAIKHIEWIRFLTSHPKDISPQLIQLIAQNKNMCRHIHLPVQHGSNRILAAMNRGYTREKYMALVKSIKKHVSDIAITTDILIGFPGETPEDFDLTLKLMAEIGFDDAFTYYYNPRPGTAAFKLEDDVPIELKKRRLQQVIELQQKISGQKKVQRLGRTVKVLVEHVSKKDKQEILGRTQYDEMVVLPGSKEKIGTFIRAELISIKGNTYKGKEI